VVSLSLLLAGSLACVDHDLVGIGTGGADGPAETGGPGGNEGGGMSDPPPGPLGELPEDDWEPRPHPSGIPTPRPGTYDDLGIVAEHEPLRSLIGLSIRDRAGLDDFLFDVGDPSSDIYGQYLSFEEFMAEHGPAKTDIELLVAWLDYVGFDVQNIASSRMLVHVHGTVGTFNKAFNTVLHLCLRKNPQTGLPPFPVYCAIDTMTLPKFIVDRSPGVLTCDLPAAQSGLIQEGGSVAVMPPDYPLLSLSPARLGAFYGVDKLWEQGYDGSGEAIAVITGTSPHYTWMQTFWQSFGIVRPVPTIVSLLEPPSIRAIEATLNPAWAGAMAPGAEIIQYAGPDTRNSSTVYVYNEAIARMPGDGAKVLTSSLAHREDSEPRLVREAYDAAAAMGASMGLTLMAASGNSGKTDTPSSSPYSLAIGGTQIKFNAEGEMIDEVAWDGSGSGVTLSFPMPPWQVGVAGEISDKHVLVDLALAASPLSSYWIFWLNEWKRYGGTSFASPAFAGMVAVMNQYRAENGLPPLGFLAPKLYLVDEVHELGFRDITVGGTADFDAGVGWDPVTGWGAPIVDVLAEIVP